MAESAPGAEPLDDPPTGILFQHGHWWYVDTQRRVGQTEPTLHGPFTSERSAEISYLAHCERVALAMQVPTHVSPALRVSLTSDGHLELTGDGAYTVLPITSTTGQEILALLERLGNVDSDPSRGILEANSLGTRRPMPAEIANYDTFTRLPMHGKHKRKAAKPGQAKPGRKQARREMTLADLDL